MGEYTFLVGEQNNFGLNLKFEFLVFFFYNVFPFLVFFLLVSVPNHTFPFKPICLVIPVSLFSHFVLFPSFSFPTSFGLVVIGSHVDSSLA